MRNGWAILEGPMWRRRCGASFYFVVIKPTLVSTSTWTRVWQLHLNIKSQRINTLYWNALYNNYKVMIPAVNQNLSDSDRLLIILYKDLVPIFLHNFPLVQDCKVWSPAFLLRVWKHLHSDFSSPACLIHNPIKSQHSSTVHRDVVVLSPACHSGQPVEGESTF